MLWVESGRQVGALPGGTHTRAYRNVGKCAICGQVEHQRSLNSSPRTLSLVGNFSRGIA
jgi:hypothetical protein